MHRRTDGHVGSQASREGGRQAGRQAGSRLMDRCTRGAGLVGREEWRYKERKRV